MTLQATPTAIPEPIMTAAIRRLTAARLDASMLQPDEGPAEIAVSYFPHRHRETAMQAFMRAQHDTSYFRLWAATDGTARVTNDQFGEEQTFPDMAAAVTALERITAQPRRS